MHLGIVPMRNGKLSSKVMFNREELKHIQEDLPKYMNEHGFELQRGKRDSKEQHLSVADYKEKMGREALNQELLDLGAPKYWHTEERRPATMSEIQDYEDIGSLFADSDVTFNIREATLEERFKWLDTHRNDLRADLGRLEGVLEKKIDEYGKIDSEASERLSELSELNSEVNSRQE